MRYVESRIKLDDENLIYRTFVTEGLKVITKNTATFEGSEAMKMNFYQFISKENEKEPTRTKEEIVEDMKAKLAALGGQNDSI